MWSRWCLRYCVLVWPLFFFFKQKTAYEMRISDWSSDVCSSDLGQHPVLPGADHDDDVIDRFVRRERGVAVRDHRFAAKHRELFGRAAEPRSLSGGDDQRDSAVRGHRVRLAQAGSACQPRARRLKHCPLVRHIMTTLTPTPAR